MSRHPSPLSLLAVSLALACGGGSQKKLGLLGADCLEGRDASCAGGRCLVLDSGTAFCTQSCQSPVDCPTGFLCAGNGGTAKACQPLGAGGVCGADADCPAGLRCDVAGAHCYIPVTRSSCGPCTSDLQCGAGGSCHAEATGERFCAAGCGAAGACATGYACKDAPGGKLCLPAGGSCRGGRPLCAPCAGDLECGGPGDLCVRNLESQETFCGIKCAGAADCAQGFSCIDLSGKGVGPSQCLPDSSTCAGYCDAPASDPAGVQRECGLGSACDLAKHLCTRLQDGSLCAACQSDDDCAKQNAASRCVANRTPGSPYLGERFCGSDCSLNGCTGAGCQKDASKCGAQFTCAGIGTGGAWPWQCVPARGSCASGFGRLGDSCEKGAASACVSGVCAHFGVEQRCSAACSADADCGDARFRCCAGVGSTRYDCTHGPTTPGSGICAPVGGSFGDDCAPGSPPCQEGLCLDLGTSQLCTKGCVADGDCSKGFACQPGSLKQADGSLGASVKVCFPGGGGALGSACAFGPAACQSHLCLKKDSGNVCTQKCAALTDCPTDWSCVEEQLAGAPDKVLVCVPPGVGP